MNCVDTWRLRPEAATGIANLFLASDYVRTNTDLATMEGANEAARRAVNALLDAVGFAGARCDVWPLHESDVLAPWRLHDAARFEAGLPWDDSLTAGRGRTPSAPRRRSSTQVRPLLEQVAPLRDSRRRRARADRRTSRRTARLQGIRVRSRRERAAAAYAPDAARQWLGVADGRRAGAGDSGPEGFLERLGWYRDMLAETLAAGDPDCASRSGTSMGW